GTTNRISKEPVVENFAWSPDGKRVAYADGGIAQSIIVAPADGSAPGETVMPAGGGFRRGRGREPGGKGPSIRPLGFQDPVGHLGASARWRPAAAPLPAHARERGARKGLPRWTMALLQLRRIRAHGGVRAGVSHTGPALPGHHGRHGGLGLE